MHYLPGLDETLCMATTCLTKGETEDQILLVAAREDHVKRCGEYAKLLAASRADLPDASAICQSSRKNCYADQCKQITS